MAKTMTESGSITGADIFSRAVRLAGILAECGIQKLELTTAAGTQLVEARTVNLPSLLHPGVTVTCDQSRFVIFVDRIEWSTTSLALALALNTPSRT